MIQCNRLWDQLSKYEHLFGEMFAGSARLTAAMRKALGGAAVRAPRDKKYGDQWDLLQDRVYETMKKEVKDRKVFYEHYSPVCTTFTYAQAQYQQRSMTAPYGDGTGRPAVEQDTKLAVRTCALARIKHALGDAFSIEHVWPTPMLQFTCFQELLALPGVFLFTLDNCAFGERYRHRQVIVTNLTCLAPLARDCDGQHQHLTLGFDKDLQTTQVSAFAAGLVKEWSRLFGDFVRQPLQERCVHCLATIAARGRPLRYGAPPPMRRVLEEGGVLGLCDWEQRERGWESEGEDVVTVAPRLGARMEGRPPLKKIW